MSRPMLVLRYTGMDDAVREPIDAFGVAHAISLTGTLTDSYLEADDGSRLPIVVMTGDLWGGVSRPTLCTTAGSDIYLDASAVAWMQLRTT